MATTILYSGIRSYVDGARLLNLLNQSSLGTDANGNFIAGTGGAPATTALNDFQVGNGSGSWIKSTLAATKVILNVTNLTESGTFVGLGITPVNKLHIDSGTATASYIQGTCGTTTGQTSGDGWLIGHDTAGKLWINQQESLAIGIKTNGTERITIAATGDVTLQGTLSIYKSGIRRLLIDVSDENCAIGYNALINYTAGVGYFNCGIGYQSLQALTTGTYNIAFGYQSSTAGNPINTITLGKQAGQNHSGTDNIAIGTQSLATAGTASYVIAIGKQACGALASGGDESVGIGNQALYLTTGAPNVALGAAAGYRLTSGTYNLFLGYFAGYNASQKVDAINSISIGYNTYTTQSNQIILGNNSIGNINNVLGAKRNHHSVIGVDTANDWRYYGDSNGFYTQKCTIGNATEGSGTWVTTERKQTVTLTDNNNQYTGVVPQTAGSFISLESGKSGMGKIIIGDNQEYSEFTFTTAAVVTLINNTANVVTTETDGKLCITDGGALVYIINELGSSLTATVIINYNS
jgi:hypothetical protein